MTNDLHSSPVTTGLLAKAQAFVDRKYVARADERQKSMGLAYVEAERQDLAREIVRFVEGLQSGPAQQPGQPVSYRWRPLGKFSSTWIYDPMPEWIENHKHEIELEPLFLAAQSSGGVAEALTVDLIASAVHEGRFSEGKDQINYCSFEDEAKSGKDYCRRIARSVIAALSSVSVEAWQPDEQWCTDNGDGSITLDCYAGWSRDRLKERCRELGIAMSEWQFAAMHAASDGSNSIEQVQEPYRAKIARMIDAYSDDPASPPMPEYLSDGHLNAGGEN